VSPVGAINDQNSHRYIGGLQLGYNYQIGMFVLGLEADYSASRRRIGTNATTAADQTCV
jgi:hypothetical protein